MCWEIEACRVMEASTARGRVMDISNLFSWDLTHAPTILLFDPCRKKRASRAAQPPRLLGKDKAISRIAEICSTKCDLSRESNSGPSDNTRRAHTHSRTTE